MASGLRCRYCRYALFADAALFAAHDASETQRRLIKKPFGQVAVAQDRCSHYFLDADRVLTTEGLAWLAAVVTAEEAREGVIACPRCRHKLGTFTWKGMQCACGAWQTPAVAITRSKVDPTG